MFGNVFGISTHWDYSFNPVVYWNRKEVKMKIIKIALVLLGLAILSGCGPTTREGCMKQFQEAGWNEFSYGQWRACNDDVREAERNS